MDPKDIDILGPAGCVGLEELTTFAQDQVAKLVEREEFRLKRRSSLRVFARLDIGIMPNRDDRPAYFVHEVMRAPQAALWLHNDQETVILTLSIDMLAGIRKEYELAQKTLCPVNRLLHQ